VYQFVIFDMDGTLVQSEDCASQAIVDVASGFTDDIADVSRRYRGKRLLDIFNDIEIRYPGSVPEDWLERYRHRENELSHKLITATDGAEELLRQMPLERCIASNAPIEKTRRSLEITGLSGYFLNNIYSAYEVEAWKPDPRLFLHAADCHGIEPENCLVVEDSEVGVAAAIAAGMSVVHYDPGATESFQSTYRAQSLTQVMDLLV